MTADADLLRRYATEASEPAFAELVRRHVDLVYSAALRQTGGNHHWAQEVTQMVFTTLARKAGSLLRHPALPAWLYRTTAYTVAMARRSAARRSEYEQRAAAEVLIAATGTSDETVNWAEVRPVLDAAMGDLPERDREAIVLRYFANAPLADVGRRLGLSENAARMRVDRALEKLRLRLERHGVTSAASAAALGLALSGQAVMAAPVGLAVATTTAAIAGATTATTAGLAALIPFMTATKVSVLIWTVAAAAGVGFLVQQQRAATQLRSEIEKDRSHQASDDTLLAENMRLQRALDQARDLKAASDRLAALRESQATLNKLLEKRLAVNRPVLGAANSSHPIFPSEKLDVQPRVLRQPHPTYPSEMSKSGQEGTVMVDFVIDEKGAVQNAFAATSTQSAFNSSAVAAVSQWVFQPGQVSGTDVAAHMQIPIVYSLGKPRARGGKAEEFTPNDWFTTNAR